MSRAFPLKTRPGLIPDDRNFGAILEDGELFVPEKLLPLFVDFKVANSDLLYALALTDPRLLADVLGWTLEQVSKARKGLGDLVQKSAPPPAPVLESILPPPSSKSSRPSFAPPPQYRPPSSLPPRHPPSFAPPPLMRPKKRSG